MREDRLALLTKELPRLKSYGCLCKQGHVLPQVQVYLRFLREALISVILCLFAVVVSAVAVEAGDEQPSGALPPALAEAIRKIHPQARIVQPREVDTNRCGPQAQPGLVVADFNGDGRKDYAVLLRSGNTKEMKHPHFDETYVAAEQWLVVFLDIDGHLRQVFTDHDWTYAPAISREIITLQPPTHLRDVSGRKEATLKHSGIAFVYCKAAARVYYWSPTKRGFTYIQISE